MKKLIFIVLTILPILCKAPPITQYSKNLRTHNEWLRQEELRKERNFKNFLFHLRLRESGDNWKIINEFGFIGHYQFGKEALNAVGLGYITTKKFRKNPEIFPPELQKEAVIRLLKINNKSLEKYYWRIGSEVAGIRITESGLLAAAHLVGATRVKRFLRTNGEYNYSDAYGTKLTDYLNEFKSYKF